MNHRSYVILPLLLVMMVASAMVPGFGLASHARPTSYAAEDQPVQVWFSGTPELTILYPTFYEFNIAAKTSSGLWITSLHWDFGDGSTLDIPFSAESYVSDVRYHTYAQPGTYIVSVTAYDNMGNSGSAQVGVNWLNDDDMQMLTTSVSSGPNYGVISPSCPSGCPETVGSNVTISILGNVSSDWLFANWNIIGAYCTGATINPCTFTMPNNPVIVTANFTYVCASCMAVGGLQAQNYGLRITNMSVGAAQLQGILPSTVVSSIRLRPE